MPLTLPATGKPRLSTKEIEDFLEPYGIDRDKFPLLVMGFRGYYKDTMGAPGVNDRGIYDDAIVIHSPSATATFNGNTDPSAYKKGTGFGAAKGMASLKAGPWFVHKFDLHHGKYLALCQRLGAVTVIRDGDPPYTDTGYFGINIHRGGYNGTSSLGCQTIHPEQWDSFIHLSVDQAKRYLGTKWNKVCIPYVLIDES
ncbi:hypothetical protein [Flavisolibacter nicotianae]|uniref:hypothetical protein n=1 Tax=Flavisolibacter nicotianae TaxID=2364882 RepID=UPI000EACD3FF|nr:hypothetical protein [Flavisolibacter nicotianae]